MLRFSLPVNVDTRIKEKFLIFPLKIKSEIRWLEKVKIRQYYSSYHGKWKNDYFMN